MSGGALEPLAVGVADAARLVGVGRSTLYEFIANGRLRSVKVNERRIVMLDDLRAWLERLAEEQLGGEEPSG